MLAATATTPSGLNTMNRPERHAQFVGGIADMSASK
jgi:hypothetical protein